MARVRRSPSGGSGSGAGTSSSRRGSGSTRRQLRSWLPSRQSFAAAEGVTLTAIVTYDVMGADQVKMPRPGPIVATMGFYALLAAVGSISRTFEPVAVAVGWVLALSVLVTGRRGAGILGVVRKLGSLTSSLGGDLAAKGG